VEWNGKVSLCLLGSEIGLEPSVTAEFIIDVQEGDRRAYHPSHALLHAASDVLHVRHVVDSWEAIWPDDAVNFFLRFALDIGENDHGLEEAMQRCSCCVGASFEEGAAGVAA
jgi:hypothetical protein